MIKYVARDLVKCFQCAFHHREPNEDGQDKKVDGDFDRALRILDRYKRRGLRRGRSAQTGVACTNYKQWLCFHVQNVIQL